MSTNRSPPIVKIYIVRHGETKENREGIIQGQLDTKLNDIGLQQAALVAEVFKDVPLIAAFSSDLERARKVCSHRLLLRWQWSEYMLGVLLKTAETILKHHPSVRLISQPELRERVSSEVAAH